MNTPSIAGGMRGMGQRASRKVPYRYAVSRRLLFAFLCMALVWAQTAPAAYAQSTSTATATAPPPPPEHHELDLSSTSKTVTAAGGGTIRVGTGTVTFEAGDLITPAQSLALSQVLSSGAQTLLIGALGNAIGGSFLLDSTLAGSINIPRGVTGLGNFSSGNGLNLSGNLTNSGKLYLFSTDPGAATAAINAQNIFNNPGGLLSSVLPANNPFGINNALGSLNLSLAAIQDIINAGIIRSSGSLTLTAGGSIINALPTGMTGTLPMMQAATNLNLNASNIVNNGVMNALAGNINIASVTAQNIKFNNMGGTLEALLGNINVRDSLFTAKSNFDLIGGNLLSQQLNIFTGNGIANVSANEIKGLVNIAAGEAHVTVEHGDLQLGNMAITGDPTFYNRSGDVLISGDLVFPDALAIVARGNITSSFPNLDLVTSAAGPNAGSITLVAGANFTVTPAGQPDSANNSTTAVLNISGPSIRGGKIDLPTLSSIDASSSTGNGGNITLIAYRGLSAPNPDSGTITLAPTSIINAEGSAGNLNGNILIVGGGNAPNAINIGNIENAGAGTGGTVRIVAGTPTIVGNSIVKIQTNGAIDPGFGQFASGTGPTSSVLVNGTINAGDTVFVLGRSVTLDSVTSAGAINVLATVGNVITTGGALTGNGITVAATGADGDVVLGGDLISQNGGGIVVAASNNIISSATNANMLIQTANGSGDSGAINLIAGGTIVPTSTIASGSLQLSVNSGSATGGMIDFSASTNGNVTANSSQNAGDINLIAFSGSSVGNGTINFANVVTASEGGVTSGNLQVLAGATSGTAITLGDVDTAGTGATDGTVRLFAAAPAVSTGGVKFFNGALTSGTFSEGAIRTSNIVTGSALEGGSTITIRTNGNVTTGNISSGGAATGGDGGTINITAGTLTLGANTYSVNGDTGTGSFDGGSITIDVSSFSGAGTLALTANGGGTLAANGGTITILSDSAFAIGAGDITLSATGGASDGNGGTIIARSGGNLTVDAAEISVTPAGANGDGGSIELFAGNNTTAGNLFVTGVLSANGAGNGSGGEIKLFSRSTSAFNLNPTATGNGATDLISAESGGGTGNGGSILIQNLGTGGITVAANTLSVDVNGSGNGGSIRLYASSTAPPTNAIAQKDINLNRSPAFQFGTGFISSDLAATGAISIESGSLNVNGAGASGNGGFVSIVGTTVTPTSGALTINANASGGGNGGQINIGTTGNNADITVGGGTGEFTLSATGGSVASATGNGGAVAIKTKQGSITVESPATNLLVGPLGTNGNGGTIQLAAGTNSDSSDRNVFVDNSIDVSGAGTGAGGSFWMLTNSDDALSVDGSATINGVTGTITADGGAVAGNAGEIILSNFHRNSSGIGIDLTSIANLSLATSDGNGGTLVLADLSSNNVRPTGSVSIALPPSIISISVPGAGNGDGGTLILQAGQVLGPSSSNLLLSANGAGSGNGGLVLVDQSQSYTVGTAAGDIMGAALAVGSGTGGSVVFRSGNTLTVDTLGIVADPGGYVQLQAPTLVVNGSLDAGSIALSSSGAINITGSITADNNIFITGTTIALGAVTSTQGAINLLATGSNASVFDLNADLNGKSIFLTASGTGADIVLKNDLLANGGSISVVANGDITQSAGVTLSTTPVAGNAGGITLVAGADTAVTSNLGTATLDVNVEGNTTTGGRIDLRTNGASTITASSTTGDAGSINIIAFRGNINPAVDSGAIVLPTGFITAEGAAASANGEVKIIGGAAVTVGGIDNAGTGATGGNTTIASAATVFTGGSEVRILDGAITGPAQFSVGALRAGPVAVELAGIESGGALRLSSGGALTASGTLDAVGNIAITATAPTLNFASSITSSAGSVVITGSDALTVGAVSADDNILLTAKTVNIGSGGATSNAGSVNVLATGSTGTTIAVNGAISGQSVSLAATGTNADINLAQDVLSNGGGISILATRDILSTAAGLDIISTPVAGNGGDITMVAGGTLTATPNSTTGALETKVTGATATGGKISLTGASADLNSSGSVTGGGGAIRLIAFRGTTAGTGVVNMATSTLTAEGMVAAPNGDITVIAGATTGTAVLLGGIDNAGLGTTGGGNVSIATATPGVSTTPAGVTFVDGTITTGNFTQGATTAGSISIAQPVTVGGNFTGTTNGAFTSTNISAGGSGTGGVGNDINLNVGTLTYFNQTYSVDGAAGNFSAGAININATGFTGAGTLALSADGTGTGSGGIITVDVDKAYTVGSGASSLSASATGGSGGSIVLKSGGNLTVDGNEVQVTASDLDGNGGLIRLEAGLNTASGNLKVTGNLNADGNGNGSGGAIELVSNSTSKFVVAPTATTNGITGNISATGGAGGSILIQNKKTGGIDIANPASLNVTASSLGGGTIELYASSAIPSTGPSGLNFNIGSSTPVSFAGGFVASNLVGTGAVTIGSGTLSADAFDGAGGRITIVGTTVTPTGGVLNLSANGADTGSGGTINVGTTGNNGNITVGNGVGQFTMSAISGINGGDGGHIGLKATNGNITVNDQINNLSSVLTAQPLGANGNGASVQLVAGSNTSADRAVFVNGLVDVSGNGTGSGGSFWLVANTAKTVLVDGTATNSGVKGTIDASGTDGGEIVISNYRRNGAGAAINIDNLSNLTTSASGGDGGTLMLSTLSSNNVLPTGAATINLPTGPATFFNDAIGGGNGGNVVLQASSFTGASNMIFSANGAGAGNGGNVVVNSFGKTTALNVSTNPGAGNITTSAGGGLTGNAGGIAISAGTLNVDSVGALDLTAVAGNGGKLALTGTNALNITNNLDASSNGAATTGGLISLSTNGVLTFAPTGTVTLDASGNPGGGSVTVNAGSIAGGPITVLGGTISLTTKTGNIEADYDTAGGTISASTAGNITLDNIGTGASNLGILKSTAGSINVTSDGGLTLTDSVTAKTSVNIHLNSGSLLAGNQTLLVSAPTVSFSTDAGSIGLFNDSDSNNVIDQRVRTSATTLNIDSADSAFINNNKALTLGSVTAANSLMISSGGTMTAGNAPIIADDIYLRSNQGSRGSLILKTQIGNNTTSRVRLSADGTGNITQTAGAFNIQADEVLFNYEFLTNDPTQPLPNGSVGTAASPIRLQTSSTGNFSLGGSMFAQNTGSDIFIQISNVANTFTLTNTGGDINVLGSLVNLSGTVKNVINLTTLSSGSDINLSGAIGFDPDFVIIPGQPTAQGSDVKLISAGGIYNTSPFGTGQGVVRGRNVTLQSGNGEDIGAAGNRFVSTSALFLTVKSANHAFLDIEPFALPFAIPVFLQASNAGATGAGDFTMFSFRPITVSGALNATNVDLEVYSNQTGSITLGANIGKTTGGFTKVAVPNDNNIFWTAGSILSPTVLLGGMTTGDVGTAAKPIKTNATLLTVGSTGGMTGNIFISNNSSNITVRAGGADNSSATTGGIFSLTNTGAISVEAGNPINAALQSASGTGNGTNKNFTFPFTALKTSDVKVYVNGTLQPTTAYTVNLSTGTVAFKTAPTSGQAVVIVNGVGPQIALKAGLNSSVTLDAALNASASTPNGAALGTINLTTSGTGSILNPNGNGVVNAPNINLTVGAGNIGTIGSRFEVEGTALTSALTAKTSGATSNIFLTANGNVELRNLTAQTIDVNGLGGASDLVLNGAIGRKGGNVAITRQDNSDIVGGSKVNLLGTILNLDSAGGSIGTSTGRIKFTLDAGIASSLQVSGDHAFLSSTKAIALNTGTLFVTDVFDLTSAGAITGSVLAPVDVRLTTTSGGIGTALIPFQAAANDLKIDSASSAFVSNALGATLADNSRVKSGDFFLAANGDLATQNISATKTIRLDAAGDIFIGDGLAASSLTAGSVILNSTGAGDVRTLALSSLKTTNITATAANGDIDLTASKPVLNVLGATTSGAGNDVQIISDGALNINGAVTSGGIVNIATSSGNITVKANVTGGGLTVLNQVGTGNIVHANKLATISGPSVAITANNGSVGTAAAPMLISTANITNLQSTGTGKGTYVSNTNGGAVTVGGISVAGPLTITNDAPSITFTASGTVGTSNTRTTDNFTVTAKTGSISFGNNVDILVNGGNATLQAIDPNATITFQDNASLVTAATAASSGVVKLVVGPKIPTNGVLASDPIAQNVFVQNPGVTGRVIIGSGSAPDPVADLPAGTAILRAKNTNLFVSSVQSGKIVLGDGVLVEADPILSSPGVTISASNSVQAAATAAAAATFNTTPSVAAPSVPSLSTAFVSPILNVDTLGGRDSLRSSRPYEFSSSDKSSSPDDSSYRRDEMSERSERIPSATAGGAATKRATLITGGVELNRRGTNGNLAARTDSSLSLESGTSLLAPEHDISLPTPFGDLKVGAKAIVLAVLGDDSLALYNLHDESRGDVTVAAPKGAISVDVGRHIFITRRSAEYETLNPLGYIAHRNLNSSQFGEGLTLFTSEFSILSAVSGGGPLSGMHNSGNPDEKRIMNRLLKDAAILMHTQAAEGLYKRITPDLTWGGSNP